MNPPLVSIIICTCNREEHLKQTLASLAAVCTSAMAAELIVVDNASTDNTAEVVQQCRLRNMPVRYLYEPRRGQCYARNAGMAASRGCIILFTDDDVRPPQNWTMGMCDPILRGQADAVAGGVTIAPHLRREWMAREHQHWLASNEVAEASEKVRLVGANMAFSRVVLDKVPQFDTELGPGALGFFDETLFGSQLTAAGFRLVSILDVRVEHHFEEKRLWRASFIDSAKKLGRSQAYVAYHWDQRRMRVVTLRMIVAFLRMIYWQVKNVGRSGAEEGLAEADMRFLESYSFICHYIKERRKPRKYFKNGLIKLRSL